MASLGPSLQKGRGETGQRPTECNPDSHSQEHVAGETEGLHLFSQAEGWANHSYGDGGVKLCSGAGCKRGNSHKLQLGRVRLEQEEDEFN